MSSENEVVQDANPTNEDLSIDSAINALYEENEETAETEEVQEDVENEVVEESVDTDEVEEEEPEEDGEIEDFKLPDNMPKELQEALSSLDEDVQKQGVEVFKKMQGSFTKKNQEFAEEKKLADEVNEILSSSGRGSHTIEQKAQYVQRFVEFDNLITSDPVAAIKQVMEYAKVKPEDLGVVANPTDSSEDDYYTDNELKLKKQVESLTEQVNSLIQTGAENKNKELSTIVSDFKNAKNEAGELVNPYFEQVKGEMMDLADIHKDWTIEQIYNKAIRMNDEVYSQVVEAEKQKAISAIEEKRKAEVEKAKRLNRQSRPTSSVDSNIVDEEAIFEQIAANAGFN
jgi:hypothetical protein